MSCDITTVCGNAVAAIEDVVEAADDAVAAFDPIIDRVSNEFIPTVINGHPGCWLTNDCGSTPSLSEIVWRIQNYGSGWSQWSLFNCSDSMLSAVQLPRTPNAPVRVTLNSVSLRQSEYSIAGDVLTFDYPIDPGDQVLVRFYGVAPT